MLIGLEEQHGFSQFVEIIWILQVQIQEVGAFLEEHFGQSGFSTLSGPENGYSREYYEVLPDKCFYLSGDKFVHIINAISILHENTEKYLDYPTISIGPG
jgi:hypothetical protein